MMKPGNRQDSGIALSAVWSRVFPLLLAGLLLACAAPASRPPQPPPPPRGQVVARVHHEPFAFTLDYTVGRLDQGLAVVGAVTNTYMSELDRFKLELVVADASGKILARTGTDYFFLSSNDRHTFSFRLPDLRGRCHFSFRYEYDYNDYDNRRRVGQSHERSYLDDWIDLDGPVLPAAEKR